MTYPVILAGDEPDFDEMMSQLVRSLKEELRVARKEPIIIVHGFIHSADQQRFAFSNVFEDELAGRLANCEGVVVIQKPQMEKALKDLAGDANTPEPAKADIGRRLATLVNANTIVTGTYQKWGKDLKIQTMIVNADTGEITRTISTKTTLTPTITALLGDGLIEEDVENDASGMRKQKVKFNIDARKHKNINKYFECFGGVDYKRGTKTCLHMYGGGHIETLWKFFGDFKVLIQGGFDNGRIKACGVEFKFWHTKIPDAEGVYYLERKGDEIILTLTKRKNILEKKEVPEEFRNAATSISLGDAGWQKYGSYIEKISLIGDRVVEDEE